MKTSTERTRRARTIVVMLIGAVWTSPPVSASQVKAVQRQTTAWPSYGNDPGGMRYAALDQIRPENVRDLEKAWTYRHGDRSSGSSEVPSTTAFEATPILAAGWLVFCTPFNRVIAVDPLTGSEGWAYDPKIDLKGLYENQLVCRGVSQWTDRRAVEGSTCRTRIFTATNDGRLIALDATDGKRCPGFATNGEYDLNPGAGTQRWKGEYQVTSPPAILGDLVIVGSAVADNQRLDAPSGVVRAFDARTGQKKWGQDFRPGRHYDGPLSEAGYALGTPNVWAVMSVDESQQLIYVPTGNPAPDFYGGDARGDMDKYGSSVVALRAHDGSIAWHFQTVHHDLWDYDVPAQPALFDFRREGRTIKALAQATKTGHLFLLDRTDGTPLFPVEERPVPRYGVKGERLSPTQPFPTRPKALASQSLKLEHIDPDSRHGRACRELMGTLRSDGIFTPPTVRGTVMFPGSGGGLNWSGVAIDPVRRVLVTNSTNVAWAVRLFPNTEYVREREANPDGEIRPQDGTPFGMSRSFFTRNFALVFEVPCNPDPWGHLVAVNLETGDISWKVPLGERFGKRGLPSLGGAIITSSGLIFIAGTIQDDRIRAFDIRDGRELWKHELPAGGQATPMTYEVELDGGNERRQFVVIAAGGNARGRSKLGDHLVAFALSSDSIADP